MDFNVNLFSFVVDLLSSRRSFDQIDCSNDACDAKQKTRLKTWFNQLKYPAPPELEKV